MTTFYKDPDAVLDYELDWRSWLGTDTIEESTWTVPDGITLLYGSHTDGVVTIWLSGGTAETTYQLTNRITTVGGRTDDRTIAVSVVQR